MKKIFSLLLSAVLLVSMLPVAYAADTQDHSLGTAVEYTATNNENWTITVPAMLKPGQGGTVTLSGTWPANRTITITADRTVTLTNSIKAANAKTLNITFPGISEAGSNVAAQTFTERVSVANIENAIFGTWSGKFNYNVDTTDEEITPNENYVGIVLSDNTIVLNGVKTAGTYTLRYANANGALDNYADICSLEVTDPATTVSYDDLIIENCAPVEATSIAVYNTANEKVGDIALDGLVPNLGTRLYSFGALADMHINDEDNTSTQNALSYLSETAGVDFTCIPGDLTSDCSDEQLAMLSNIVSTYSANTPVYMATGNHDTPFWRGMGDYWLTEYTDLKDTIESTIGTPLYYSFTQGDDVFIMVGVQSNKDGNCFSQNELQWLYETLEANRNKRCFVFQHVLTANSSGDVDGWYSNGSWVMKATQKKVFESLIEHYSNVTWFHGHSHQSFLAQSDADSATYTKQLNSHSVNIPSAYKTRGASSNYIDKSEGYVVDVYENGIVLKGRDFDNDVFLPIAQYYLDTTLKIVNADTYIDETATINCEKAEIEWTYGTHINKTTGAVEARDAYATTNLISVDTSKTIYYHALYGDYHGFDICCYDSDGNYLGYSSVPFASSNLYTTPTVLNTYLKENTASIRIRMYITDETTLVRFALPIFITFK